MKPFVLTQHEKDRQALFELRKEHLAAVTGGCPSPDPAPKLSTYTIRPEGGSDDGCDEG